MFKCAHISDIHFRSLKRHKEYKVVFDSLFEKLHKTKGLDAIFIGGDIVHSKTQGITPELIDILSWWFTSLANIAPTYVILGNHDGLILNDDRQDAITPIVNALDNENIYLYKKSGVYPLAKNSTGLDINWCVFSCFDEKNWSKVKPIENEINIACFHGAVTGSKTDIDWELEGEVKSSFFQGFDFGFLGDIHKYQYIDEDKRIAYPGSTIQQNYGESIKKGFLLWEIRSKNDFKSSFVSVKNPSPFITLDWQGNVEETLLFASKVKKGVKFRIRSDENISQAEIELIHHYLKNEKEAKEIVYQLSSQDIQSSSHFTFEESFNIRSKSDRNKLINEYFENIDLTTLEKLDSIFAKNLDKIPQDLKQIQGQQWSINSLEFDNTFSYGKGNYINFDNMKGIVGLFGNNRSGKSSIPGTLMYALFNTTDRGSLKNQDIVNIRKGSCSAIANISIGSEKYVVERKTVKKTNKKNITSATTSLSLRSFTNKACENETEEQRRETEKSLKKLIGASEDFLYTTFASQGEMNTFVKEKNSARKSILSKFLNIKVYEELYNQSREEYTYLKTVLNSKEEKDWNGVKSNSLKKSMLCKEDILKKEEETSELRKKLMCLNIELEHIKTNSNKHPSGQTLSSARKEKAFLETTLKSLSIKKRQLNEQHESIKQTIFKIKEFKQSFSIDDLNSEKDRLVSLEKKLTRFKTILNEENSSKKTIEEELKILDQVPCGDQFKSCKFIEKAHNQKGSVDNIRSNIKVIETNILELNGIINRLKEDQINEKIKKFELVLKKEYKSKIDLESVGTKLEFNSKEIEAVLPKIDSIHKTLKELEALNIDESVNNENQIMLNINDTQNKINKNDIEVLSMNRNIFILEEEIIKLEKEKEEYYRLIEEFRVNDIFSSLVSKKGIPTVIINSCLPKINKEINSILNGVVSFKLSLEEDKGNNLNIYIDYGDSKRVIECASGMEKMISSIAIRVALINVSALAKSDIFIIDEGFGALDDSNIDSCSRLLSSLKKYFKSIIIISHIDAVKDIVDKNIEINIKGNDSYVRFE